jgi:dephospho-CoA kinase
MLKVGLTGGIASGKTTVARMLAAKGAHVIFADAVAHQLMSPGEAVYAAVVAAFGREILDADGTIDRPKLAAAAFPARVQELNGIVHPAVVAYQDGWMREIEEREPDAIAVVEAALIFEAGAESHFDKLITVRSELEQKALRLANRQQLPFEAARTVVQERMKAQLPEDRKAAASDYVIENSGGMEELQRSVDRLWPELQKAARSGVNR